MKPDRFPVKHAYWSEDKNTNTRREELDQQPSFFPCRHLPLPLTVLREYVVIPGLHKAPCEKKKGKIKKEKKNDVSA